MYKTNVDIFLETGNAVCKKHGSHCEWYFNPVKMKLKNGKIQKYKAIVCKICARESTRRINDRNPNLQDDYRFSFNGTLTRILAQARGRAKKKNLPFDININWLKEQLCIQKYTCAYSGVKFDFSRPSEYDRTRKYLPSIDQRISGLGYTKENSEIICCIVNLMKNDLLFDDFTQLCIKIAKYNNGTL